MLFAYPFRTFFVSAGIWGVLSIGLWILMVTGHLSLPLALDPAAWHAHEMLFGLAPAAIAGFLLTAVCVWTGTDRLNGTPLLLLWLVWVAGRLLMMIGCDLPDIIVISVNLLFLPLVLLDACRRIIAARQTRHAIILLSVAGLWASQLSFLLTGKSTALATGLLATALLMLAIGGRITPNFSASWLAKRSSRSDSIRNHQWLETLTFSCTAAVLLLTAFSAPAGWVIATASLSALLCTIRVIAWRGWLILANPLLWILHLSLLWIPAGLFLLAGSAAGRWDHSTWYHALGVGALGSLFLGVASRVSLGHTGRELIASHTTILAFTLINIGAAVRVVTALGLIPWLPGVISSAAFWLTAFVLFCHQYIPVLTQPRIDGKPG